MDSGNRKITSPHGNRLAVSRPLPPKVTTVRMQKRAHPQIILPQTKLAQSNNIAVKHSKNIFQHKNKRDASCIEPHIKITGNYPNCTPVIQNDDSLEYNELEYYDRSQYGLSQIDFGPLDEPLFTSPILTVPNAEDLDAKHAAIWSKEMDGKRHIVSQGDLKYDLGQEILIILPFYVSKGVVTTMTAVTGTIIDINYITVQDNDEIPRETISALSPKTGQYSKQSSKTAGINLDMYKDEKEWAKPLTIQNWKDKTIDACQTMVTGYKIKLHDEFILTHDEINMLYNVSHKAGSFPYYYDLKFQSTRPTQNNMRRSPIKRSTARTVSTIFDCISVDYRYVMGELYECKKILSEIIRKDIFTIGASDFETYISKLQLNNGVFVRYVDSDGNRRNSGIIHFLVIDHICMSPLDIKFVVKCDKEPVRILAISKIYPFDVRISYSVENLHCFHSLERYVYEILAPSQGQKLIGAPVIKPIPQKPDQTQKANQHQKPDQTQKAERNEKLEKIEKAERIERVEKVVPTMPSLDQVRDFLFKKFDELKVYIVKKSLCQPNDLEFCIYENREGDIKVIPRHELAGDIDSHSGFKYDYSIKTSYEEQRKNSHVCRVRQPTHVSRNGYKFTGISLASYVKGLAYPDGNSPSQHDLYTFFHSKDYHELNLNPVEEILTLDNRKSSGDFGSLDEDDEFCNVDAFEGEAATNGNSNGNSNNNTFMSLVCVGDTKKEFRDPNPKDIILAIPFLCDKGQYAGKMNLKWFYPDNEFRLLHIFITSRGTTALPDLRSLQISLSKNVVSGPAYVALLDLYVYGFSQKNPTRDSAFTKKMLEILAQQTNTSPQQ